MSDLTLSSSLQDLQTSYNTQLSKSYESLDFTDADPINKVSLTTLPTEKDTTRPPSPTLKGRVSPLSESKEEETTHPTEDEQKTSSSASTETDSAADSNDTETEIEYDDGSKYVGKIDNNNQKHGPGVLTLADGVVFEGEWSNDDLSNGTITYTQGQKYVGEIQNYLAHGNGKMTYDTGASIEGRWEGGHIVRGISIAADGGRYEGQFLDGVESGKGKYFFPNGDTLEGQWINGECPKGVLKYKIGSIYKGQLVNRIRHGTGSFRLENGDCMTGTWVDGDIVKGTLTTKVGKKYVGEFQNWKPHGYGSMYIDVFDHERDYHHLRFCFSELIYRGNWNNGLSEGELYGNNRLIYKGEFHDFQLQGKGTYYYADGRQIIGVFHGDKPKKRKCLLMDINENKNSQL